MNPRRGPRRSISPSPRSHPPGSRRRVLALPFLRSRIHPLLLIPVFLLGAYFAPFHSNSTPTYAGEPYRGEDAYDWSKDSFLPPDAPPLNAYDEDYGIRKVDGGDGKLSKLVRGRGNTGREGLDDDRDLLGWGSSSSSSSDSPSYFAELEGYLYYPASAPLVDIDIPKAAKKVPSPLIREATPPQNAHGEPELPPWSIPGAQFKKKVAPLDSPPPPPVRPLANAPAPLNPLQLPLQPPRLPARPIVAPARGPIVAPGRGIAGPARRPAAPVIERGADGRRLGPNAAAMIRAEREGRPFRPGRPADMVLEENLKIAAAKARVRKQAADEAAAAAAVGAKKAAAVFGPGGGRGIAGVGGRRAAQAAAVPARALAAPVAPILPGRGVAPPAAAALPGRGVAAPAPAVVGKGRGIAGAGVKEVKKAAPVLEHEESIVETTGDDFEAEDLLEEIRGLTEEERSFLSADELALIDAIEVEYAAPRKPDAAVVLPKVVEKPRQGRGIRRGQVGINRPAPAPAAPQGRGIRGVPPAQPQGRGVQGQGRERMQKRALDFDDSGSEPLVPPPESHPLAESSDVPPSTDTPLDPLIPVDTQDSKSTLAKRAAVVSPPSNTAADRVHPISYLIKSAEKKWDVMLQQQSQTLGQAVFEYKRRYGRNPPLGFDHWWRYAMQNRVILVDEYDQINDDIEPFFSLSAAELALRAQALATNPKLPLHAETFSIRVKDGALVAFGPKKLSVRAEDAQDIMSEFVESLPDVTLTFSSREGPLMAVSGEAKARHRDYARHGLVLDKKQANAVLENTAYLPWQGLCAPNATARRVASGVGLGQGPFGPSFVSTDHIPAMDMCNHPEIQFQNGFTAWDGPRPYLLYPIFSWFKTSMHSDLLSVPLEQYYTEVGVDPVWEKKKDKVLWRGSSTGTFREKGTPWRSAHRDRLVLLTGDQEGEREVRFADDRAGDAVRRFSGSVADINDHYFDVAFSGAPAQCDRVDGTCEAMRKDFRFEHKMVKEEVNKFKYVLDVDGNGWSGKFHRLMLSRSLVFKSTIFPEWFSRRVIPWYHYVPIKTDYSDLHDVAAFFMGAPDGQGLHDALAKKIASNGKKWAEEHWREVDMAAYQYRLYLEYARLVSRDGDSHDFIMAS